ELRTAPPSRDGAIGPELPPLRGLLLPGQPIHRLVAAAELLKRLERPAVSRADEQAASARRKLPKTLIALGRPRLDARLELGGRLLGERERDDRREIGALPEQADRPLREHLRLVGAGVGGDAQAPAGMRNGFALAS